MQAASLPQEPLPLTALKMVLTWYWLRPRSSTRTILPNILADGNEYSSFPISSYKAPRYILVPRPCLLYIHIQCSPVRGLRDADTEIPATPHALFFGTKPRIGHLRTFGCPVVIRKWTASDKSNGKQTERGPRNIHWP
jgi:hypothetical protein